MTRGVPLATEWLWCNFPPPVALHDYRHLGASYRERIKRLKSTNPPQATTSIMRILSRYYLNDKRNKMERHLEQYGDWVVSEFGEDGQRSRLITWYVFDSDKFRRNEPGWRGTSITKYRDGTPSHVTLLDAAGLEVEAWAVHGDGR